MITVETFASADQVQGSLTGDATYLGGGTLVMRALNYGQQDFARYDQQPLAAHKRPQRGTRSTSLLAKQELLPAGKNYCKSVER